VRDVEKKLAISDGDKKTTKRDAKESLKIGLLKKLKE